MSKKKEPSMTATQAQALQAYVDAQKEASAAQKTLVTCQVKQNELNQACTIANAAHQQAYNATNAAINANSAAAQRVVSAHNAVTAAFKA